MLCSTPATWVSQHGVIRQVMSPEEFRKAARAHSDWIAEYMEHVREFPVVPSVRPGEIAAKLPTAGPERGEPIEQIFADFQSTIVPGLTLWNHPNLMHGFQRRRRRRPCSPNS